MQATYLSQFLLDQYSLGGASLKYWVVNNAQLINIGITA